MVIVRIIESKKEFDSFIHKYNDYNWTPIIHCTFTDSKLHPKENEIAFLTIRLDDDYILPFNHSETIELDTSLLEDLKSDTTKFVFNKKEVLHSIDFGGMVDINFLYYLETNKSIDIENDKSWMWENLFHKPKNINTIIPILKQYETIKKFLDVEFSEKYYIKEYDDAFNLFSNVESCGLQKNDEKVYSQYNLYTSTGRPSNRFGGINFAALNKKDESRKSYVSRFKNEGMLVEFDYDAYHLRLIGEVVNYKFPESSVHEHMSKFYGCDYKESKRRSFQYLYGHIPIEVVQMNPFFGKVQDFIDNLWKSYKKNKYIESYIYRKKIFARNFDDEMNKTKLFNYFIQNLETERNIEIMRNLLPKISEYKSKLALYNYDAFLIDFNLKDGLSLLRMIKKEMEKNNYPTTVSHGKNYHEMEDITEKFVD